VHQQALGWVRSVEMSFPGLALDKVTFRSFLVFSVSPGSLSCDLLGLYPFVDPLGDS